MYLSLSLSLYIYIYVYTYGRKPISVIIVIVLTIILNNNNNTLNRRTGRKPISAARATLGRGGRPAKRATQALIIIIIIVIIIVIVLRIMINNDNKNDNSITNGNNTNDNDNNNNNNSNIIIIITTLMRSFRERELREFREPGVSTSVRARFAEVLRKICGGGSATVLSEEGDTKRKGRVQVTQERLKSNVQVIFRSDPLFWIPLWGTGNTDHMC